MDCSSICLLALSLALPQPHNIQKCEYCMDVRLLNEHCFDDFSSCMNATSDSILYCLTIHEVSSTLQVNRLVRCLSHSDFSLTLENTEKLFHEGSCSRRSMMSCNCSTCRLSTEAAQTFEEELHADDNGGDDDDDTVEQSTSLKNTAAMSMNFNYEATEQSKAKAEKEELMKSVNGQIMMDQPEMKTANTNDYCIVYTTLSLLSSIMLLYLCQ